MLEACRLPHHHAWMNYPLRVQRTVERSCSWLNCQTDVMTALHTLGKGLPCCRGALACDAELSLA